LLSSEELQKQVDELKAYIERLGQTHAGCYAKVCGERDSMREELDTLRKAYDVTNESWKKMVRENEQLRRELDHYKAETAKIPSVCRWWQDILQDIPEGEPCTRMLMDMCPQICHKYRKEVEGK
jgi:SMC interacting uncharacterized protein involved in chromosome segregation